MRTYARIAGAAVVGAFVCGCGTQSDFTAVANPKDPASVRVVAEQIYDDMYGTLNQQGALQYLTGYDLNHEVQVCMNDRGFDWTPILTTTPHPRSVDPLGDTVWLREPMRPITSENLALGALFARREAQVESTRLLPEMTEAVLKCRDEFPGPSDDDLDTRGFTGVNQGRALYAFEDMVDKVDRELAYPAEYEECMSAAGFRLGSADDGRTGMYFDETQRLQMLAPSATEIPVGDEALGQQWRKFLGIEEESLRADSSCREAHYAAGMEKLAPELEEFQRDFGGQVDLYAEHWTSVEDEARSKGWTPNAWEGPA